MRILAAARELFAARGINAVGVAELSEAARVSKRTLYHHFPSKSEVVVAALREASDETLADPESALSRADLSPRAQLLELFEAAPGTRRPLRGSPFIAAAIEAPDPRDPVHIRAIEHTQAFTDRLVALARDAGARDPELVGRRLALLYAGAAAQSVVLDSPDPAADARALAAAILRDAID